MSCFLERMQQEKNELSGRLARLDTFIRSDRFRLVDRKDRELMVEQLLVMKRYYGVLNMRLAKYSGVNRG